MYDLVRFLPLILTFGFFPVLAFACRRFLSPDRQASALAVAGLGLLPLLCILAAGEGMRLYDVSRFVVIAAPVIVSYPLLFIIHWALVRQWGARAGAFGIAPILFPIAVLGIAKYTPGHWGEIYGGMRFTELYLGLSYVAFRLSLLAVEVRNRTVPPPSLSEYLGFTFLTSTLAVGPISRYSLFRSSLSEPVRADVEKSVLRFVKGATKYLVLANLANQFTYAGLLKDGHPHGSLDVVIAIVSYYYYLYLNFSGYCDMVIATASLCGIEIEENFDSPLTARNLQEFWRRWHMTLGNFLRDLLFSPLSKYFAGKLGGQNIQHAVALSIFCVFLVIGVWHGFGWNFLLYGAAHGTGVVIVQYYTQLLKRGLGRPGYQRYMSNPIIKVCAIVITQLFAAFSLILFANPLPEVGHLLRAVISGPYVP
jgi:D-alanyl-lipoteichoic acid acyltransferase DltB (MBOAT superfamily)